MDVFNSKGDVPSAISTLSLLLFDTIFSPCLWFIWRYFNSPLRRYPGPFLAGKPHLPSLYFDLTNIKAEGCTDLWRLYHVWRGSSHLVVQDLHKKFGPVVRIGPNLLDLDYPELVKTIYNIKGDWLKVKVPNSTIDGDAS